MKTYNNSEDGYTLAELLIVMVISTILISAAGATYVTQNRSYIAQESVSEVNTQSKIARDLIVKDVKHTGFGTPWDMNVDPINARTTIIDPFDRTVGPDAVTIVGGFRQIGTLWPQAMNPGDACPANPVVPIRTTAVKINYIGNVRPNLADASYLSIDGIQFVRVNACTLTDGFCDDDGLITLDRPLAADFPILDLDDDGNCETGRAIYLVEDLSFCLNGTNLMRIGRNGDAIACTGFPTSQIDVLAENVESFQLAYGVDLNNDGMIDDWDTSGQIDAGDFIPAGLVADFNTIAAVRLNIVATSDRPDPDFAGLGSPPPLVENQAFPAVNDSLRRRWWQSIIAIRNHR